MYLDQPDHFRQTPQPYWRTSFGSTVVVGMVGIGAHCDTWTTAPLFSSTLNSNTPPVVSISWARADSFCTGSSLFRNTALILKYAPLGDTTISLALLSRNNITIDCL